MSITGIGLGTSSTKGAVLDLESKYSQRLPFPAEASCSTPLSSEFEPDSIVSAVQDLINDLMQSEPRCTGIVMCTQLNGTVLMTGKKENRSNCLTWCDQRAWIQHPSRTGAHFDVMTGSNLIPCYTPVANSQCALLGLMAFIDGGKTPHLGFVQAVR